MIPLRDVQPRRSTPAVVIGLIAANILVYLYQLSLGHGVEQLFQRYALIPAKFWDPSTYSRGGALAGVMPLFTSMFLHGGVLHLGLNVWFLWVFGDNVEDRLGKVRFLAFYLVTGIAAGLTHAIFSPASPVPTIGASGAISGVLGAYIVLFPAAKVVALVPVFILLTTVTVPAFVFLAIWFGMQFLFGMASLGTPGVTGGTAWFAHVGGFLAGMALVKILDKRRRNRHGRRWSDEEDLS